MSADAPTAVATNESNRWDNNAITGFVFAVLLYTAIPAIVYAAGRIQDVDAARWVGYTALIAALFCLVGAILWGAAGVRRIKVSGAKGATLARLAVIFGIIPVVTVITLVVAQMLGSVLN